MIEQIEILEVFSSSIFLGLLLSVVSKFFET